MKFLSDQKILSKEFKRLSESYSHYKGAVAWAGKEKGFDFAEVLEKNKSKLTTLVVGLHFYQTDPDFIEHHMTNSHVRFIKKTEGIFHSKVYLFYNKEDDWADELLAESKIDGFSLDKFIGKKAMDSASFMRTLVTEAGN